MGHTSRVLGFTSQKKINNSSYKMTDKLDGQLTQPCRVTSSNMHYMALVISFHAFKNLNDITIRY